MLIQSLRLDLGKVWKKKKSRLKVYGINSDTVAAMVGPTDHGRKKKLIRRILGPWTTLVV